MEWSLHASRAIGVALLVRAKDEAQALGERGHLWRRHHVRAGAGGHDHVRVVDHPHAAGAAEVAQGVGEEQLAGEAVEARVVLEEQHARVAQDQAGGLDAPVPTGQEHIVRRRVVLHLLAPIEVILASRLGRRVTDSVVPAERGQRGVGQPSAQRDELPRAPAPGCPCRRRTARGSARGTARLARCAPAAVAAPSARPARA